MIISGRPLLVTGKYGRGKTVVFTGFTPRDKTMPPGYRDLFMRMLVEVGGEKIRAAYDRIALPRKLLFECLKGLPETSLSLPESLEVQVSGKRAQNALTLANGGGYARLVRMRVEWDKSEQGVPFLQFSDNFINLLPLETRSIALDWLLPQEQFGKTSGTLVVEGPNVKIRRIPIQVRAP